MGASFIIASMFYSALLLIIYFSKDKEKKDENKVYGYMIVTNFIGLIISLLSYSVTLNKDMFGAFTTIINKLYLIYLLTFLILFIYYTFLISFSKKINMRFDKYDIYRKIKSIFIKVYFVFAFALLLLPLYYESAGVDNVYSYGPGSLLCILMSAFGIILSLIFMIVGRKNIRKEKFIPLITYIILLPLSLVLEYKYPNLLLTTPIETFIVFLIFFTIENPDLDTINNLSNKNNSLEESNDAKNKFLSNISHEIRTPLTNIIGFTDSLKEKNKDMSIKGDIDNISVSANNLLEVVNGILDLSKFDKDKVKLNIKNYDLKSMIEEIRDFSKELLGNKKVAFRTSFDTDMPKVLRGDYVVLRQIILNMIANAMKRTEVGYIEFSVSTISKGDTARVIISVEDTGGTLKEKKLESIFKGASNGSDNYKIEGVVASLPETYKLVKLMNGKIMAQNVYERGLKVTVAIDQGIVTNEVEKDVLPDTPIDIASKNILIVDDNRLNIKVAERLLAKYNVNIKSVTSGSDCISLINNGETFDLILMDDMMPELSGVETFKKLKTNPSFNTPTVMLTANAMEGMREKYISQDGFDDYIAKPIAKDELERVLRSIFRK